ncbi:glycosyltransferase family 4 protein [Erythrobacter sp. sf7]|uniref:Glycosyltransferase family 4 protein n=1 Tax=Erythrobacter fulvus TaxID=2987523 RepID=A0ABT5JN85_9SPHN|nr:glycosyltransferase family 4 protein [Erythrobacter fulvus]MDC8753598.1 glycosyltransferase family 4 protein [Erythrobacter fulvus]
MPLKKIAISSWIIDVMSNVYGDGDVKLVPNAVDHNLFFASKRRKNYQPTIGLMYSLKEFKGVDVALEAIDLVRQSQPFLRLVAFGAERPSKGLPLPAQTQFFFDPPQHELRNIYAACDVFLVASRSEGFGLPILEAMACRTPVVATRTGCAADVIEEAHSGYVVDPEDPNALADRLTKVLTLDASSWQRMSEAAHKRSLEFTWEQSAKLFERALLDGVRKA